jgi:single-strand DNA-binding protein
MSSVNKAILVGRLGSDPEVREVGRDGLVANFSLATDESYKDKDGQKVKKVEWHRIVVWGKLAEIVEKYLGTGDLIYVEGKLQTRSYEDTKSGATKSVTEINVFQMQMLQTQNKDENPAPERAAAPAQRPASGGRARTAAPARRERLAPEAETEADDNIGF